MLIRTFGILCFLLSFETGFPQTICPTGKFGENCDQDCSSNCFKNCHKTTGACIDACIIGKYGSHCNDDCSECQFGCDKDTGACPCDLYGCAECGSTNGTCELCDETRYMSPSSEDPLKCCSRGCPTQHGEVLDCHANGVCIVEGCLPDYWGERCTKCSNTIENCRYCSFLQNTNDLICRECLSGYTLSNDQFRCCPPGCDDCAGDVCSKCKGGYYIYGEICDTCGKNCNPPSNGSARCDPNTGRCYYGCLKDWHGSQCQKKCDLPNCGTCDYFEQADRLTCITCSDGYAPNTTSGLCETCNSNCIDGSCDSSTGSCTEGCLPGWRADRCDMTCAQAGLSNCSVCGRDDSTCSKCLFDFWGAVCEMGCSEHCVPVDDDNVCHKDTAACARGCLPGYWQDDCTNECPNCLGDLCQIDDGICQQNACKPGYWGRNCMSPCSSTCADNPATGDRECGFQNGFCTHGCKYNRYGDICEKDCSRNCFDNTTTTNSDEKEPLCYQESAICKWGCNDGYYHRDCTGTCESTCVTGACDILEGYCLECNKTQPGWLCYSGDCDKGFYGLYCNMMCPVNCYGGVCIRDSGLCQDCNSAWYGSNCTSRCPNCKEDICIQSNGHCIRGCKDGFYKDKCDEPCLYEGCQDCSRDSGMCITCKVGKYNSNCSEDCSPRCELTDKGLRTCSKASGDCDAKACIPGYWSETCRQECSSYCDTTDNECDLKSGSCTPCKVGHFGLTCRLECSVRCKNQNCDGTLDNCLQGCADGFWGAACEKQCNGNCQQKLCNISSGACTLGCERDMFYGPTCKEPCNSNCVGGECETDGYCRDGCKTGTYGRRCENACPDKATCTDGTCDRILGYCSECDAADPGPLCPTAVCPSGKWGLNCTNDCFSTTCLFNRCTRDHGICIGCPIGRTGSQCDRFCGQCKVGTGCDQMSGFCGEGCRDGYYGDECKQQCDLVCKSCERQPPAKCVECTDNRWGPSCLKTCNPNCAKTIIGSLEYTLCDKGTGYCSEGACINNKNWNDDCSKTCPQNCLPDNNGYKTCRISDGACSIGCVDTYYGVHCTERCSTQCRGQICKDEANNCVNGCENGFYNPPTCSGTCSEHCKESRNCDRVTGTCADGCAAGYFGLQCIEQCYGKCKDGTCDDLGGCPDCRISPVGPNCHPQVCPPLKYGPSCESDCPGLYCKDDACHRQTGKCPQGCRDWFHGEYCTERCICHVAGTTLCNQTGICECKAGWTSVDCSQRCSDGCRNSVCEKNGQCTFGCIAGRYGTTCENKCINCVNEACDSDTGKCDIGCKPGYYGMRCDSQCPENCYTCDSSSECTACLPFRYGLPSCTQRCSSTCKQPSSGRVCYESNGACIGGCLLGFWDDQCTRQCGSCGGDGTCLQPTGTCTAECLPGYTTLTCATPCSDSCAKGGSSNQRECRRDTGACEHGCEMGYHGDFCEPCSDRCLDNKCSSAFICTDGCIAPYYSKKSGCNLECSGCQNGRCNDTGGCLTGCAKGFHGTMCTTVCSKTCTDGTCDQLTGQCKDCKETPVGPLCREPDIETATVVTTDERLSMEAIIGISAGCAVAVILIAILMVCCVFYRRKATDAKNEIHLPSEVLERLSNHGRSHHSTISSQYPVARVVGDDEKDFVLF